MKKSIRIPLLLIFVLSLFAFTADETKEFVGTYGVSAGNPSQIRLTLNADHSFYFQDLSVAAKKIVVNGTWKIKNSRVILHSNDNNKKFHRIWTFTNKGKVARSRKGLCFYRLLKTEE